MMCPWELRMTIFGEIVEENCFGFPTESLFQAIETDNSVDYYTRSRVSFAGKSVYVQVPRVITS